MNTELTSYSTAADVEVESTQEESNSAAAAAVNVVDDDAAVGAKRARMLDMTQQAKFWESEYKKLKALKMSGPETMMEVMKEEFNDMEKALKERIGVLEEKLQLQGGDILAPDKKQGVAVADDEQKFKILETKLTEQEQIINFYELFTSSRVKLVEGDNAFECCIENYPETKRTVFRFERSNTDPDTEFRAESCENPQYLPEYLHDGAIDFDSSQCPYLMKDILIEMFKDDENEDVENQSSEHDEGQEEEKQDDELDLDTETKLEHTAGVEEETEENQQDQNGSGFEDYPEEKEAENTNIITDIVAPVSDQIQDDSADLDIVKESEENLDGNKNSDDQEYSGEKLEDEIGKDMKE